MQMVIFTEEERNVGDALSLSFSLAKKKWRRYDGDEADGVSTKKWEDEMMVMDSEWKRRGIGLLIKGDNTLGK